MADELVVLRGGSRDGESTTVDAGVRRLVAVSEAPGLLDVYEATEETTQLERSGAARVFAHTGQESAADIAPEAMHLPSPGTSGSAP